MCIYTYVCVCMHTYMYRSAYAYRQCPCARRRQVETPPKLRGSPRQKHMLYMTRSDWIHLCICHRHSKG